MKILCKLKEECGKIDRDFLSQVKKKYEYQASKPVGRPTCVCAECAVEHKDREISSLRKNYQALQAVQRIVADVQRELSARQRAASPKVQVFLDSFTSRCMTDPNDLPLDRRFTRAPAQHPLGINMAAMLPSHQ